MEPETTEPERLPHTEPVGSWHLLCERDGTPCVGRVETNGWTIYFVTLSVSALEADRQGIRYVKALNPE